MPERVRKKPLVIFAAVLAVGVVASGLLLGKMRERTDFIGNADPVSGYRCRFTVSLDWKEGEEATDVNSDLVNVSFNAPAPSPIRTWIESHLLHRPASLTFDQGRILITNSSLKEADSPYHLVGGYPELKPSYGTYPLSRHRRVNGLSVTESQLNLTFGNSYQVRLKSLIVYVPESRTLYQLSGISEPSIFAPTDRELQAILSSFRVEKVSVSTNSKP